MNRLWIPSLRPNFTWPRPMQSTICQTTPEIPALPCKIRRRVLVLFMVQHTIQCMHYTIAVWVGLKVDRPNELRGGHRDANGASCRNVCSKRFVLLGASSRALQSFLILIAWNTT
ncbi:hypothetical protein N7449_010326 [Penicillium cf. viridicatum]|uniref:Uncharacterized protein n=1 Tax=Penicillium cf. viridicatum TaxID=2972119 RepID=A0A9W9J0E1_9EURO|nr:hypothetical protein N7449_010326 [Penicillium cf. viridicatum]